jgi:cell division protein FtsQ
VEVEAVSTRPVTLPYLDVDVASGGPVALTAALDVQSALPTAISDRLRSIGATSRDGVWLTMDNGARVVWGSADASAEKVEVLRALVTATPDAALYDVSAPDAPAVSRRTVREPLILAQG